MSKRGKNKISGKSMPITQTAPNYLDAASVRAGKGAHLQLTIDFLEIEKIRAMSQSATEHHDTVLHDLIEWKSTAPGSDFSSVAIRTASRFRGGALVSPEDAAWTATVPINAASITLTLSCRTNFWGVVGDEKREGGARRGIAMIVFGQWMNMGFPAVEDPEQEQEWVKFCEALNERNRAIGLLSPFPEDAKRPTGPGRPRKTLPPLPIVSQACPECGTIFTPTRRGQVYDKIECARRAGLRRRRTEARKAAAQEETKALSGDV